jgi:hypothetical protein
VGDALYYSAKPPFGTLPDPTAQSSQGSTSLTLADADGTPAGYALYDGYGGVLTATLPATLTAQGVITDPDTGLVYLGEGRFYDPVLGRPLQPNPAGGPPTVPQALNRYAATPLGQPGVAEGGEWRWYTSSVGHNRPERGQRRGGYGPWILCPRPVGLFEHSGY